MEIDLEYFRTVQGTLNIHDEPTYKAVNAQEMLLEEFQDSINYIVDAKRNGELQPMIITGSEVKYKYNITTMPGDELYPGDIIEANGEHYIVVQTDGTITYLKRQFKIYLPSDEDTDKIYIDKRLAVGTMYDQDGNEILEAYIVTGRTKFGKGGYGDGAHLLEMNAKSSEQVGAKDNIELMVCDYIAPEDGDDDSHDETAVLSCEISGRNNVRLGGSRTFSAIFYDADGEVTTVDTPVWTYDAAEGVTVTPNGTICTVKVPDDDQYAGTEVVLRLGDGGVNYKNSTR